MKGWIKLHRKLHAHWLYKESRKFSKFEAWLDLLIMANHKEHTFVLGNELIQVKRGEVITSEVKLMDKWKWSKSKVRSFLKLLEKDGMVIKKSDTKKTSITICNYCYYQDIETIKNTTVKPELDFNETEKSLSSDTIKNDNNEMNEDNEKNDEEIPYIEIIDYLNQAADKNYKHNILETRELIKQRWIEGNTLADFKKVIDSMVIDWKHDIKMKSYLRPKTLFSEKFEEYLNRYSNEDLKSKLQYRKKFNW
ncbi:conserved phage C-terminal domain-containing protein [Anaerobacillus sp. CMMVII]|uniref:conserved phage C-terminal domain-containing protein n=1 Tax=Anaerobacillus sp. CMMVII TaxID=2755588 RepID=UPI0021B6F728|nr:conserved phage C-terminal domain-containing protein [Anaerobacillus sp. CMMVII]MCT8136472.1 conserved phage C-terminal domain-containing protein [Anaerobacillus sp. CMMVII]